MIPTIILGTVGVFFIVSTICMLFIVMILGTPYFKRLQHLMSSLEYSEEMDAKVNMLIERYNTGLATARLATEAIDFFDDSTFLGSISIKGKYWSYGYVTRYGSHSLSARKVKMKTFSRVVELEKKLRVDIPAKENKKNEKEAVTLE